ncbi:MAG: redoxin family protein [Pirellulaceae bacterium]
MSRVRMSAIVVIFGLTIGSLLTLGVARSVAAEPSPQLVKALSYEPRQSTVGFERVSREQFKDCAIEEKIVGKAKGFWVTGAEGQPLRWFADTNADNRLDQWSYFDAGVEVYRESDSDFNGTADSYRWLNTSGLRAGKDADEDGQIDSWDTISAEEATAEVVAATAERDAVRFSRLLISPEEIKALKLGKETQQKLLQRVSDAAEQFGDWSRGQNIVTSKTKWSNFGADKPGLVPAGTDGSQADVIVYENVVALVDDAGKSKQLLVGTLIDVGGAWRIVDLPMAISEGAVVGDGGVFFSASFTPRGNSSSNAAEGGLSAKMTRLVEDLQGIDAKLLESSSVGSAELQAQRANVLEKLVAESETAAERTTWIKQFADTVSAATQTGTYPAGVSRLQTFTNKLGSVDVTKNDIAYVVFRMISADHNVRMQQPKAKYDELQEAYLKRLQDFVRKYPASDDAAEAMLQMGLSAEFSGEANDAKNWYRKASLSFSGVPAGRKAAGALKRLSMNGKPFRLQAQRLGGGAFDSAAYRGSPVIYHGWATWCEACKAEMRALKELQAKYAKSKLQIVGINFDNEEQQGVSFLRKQSYPWVHLYEQGGLESDLAVENGFLSLPVNIVVDGDGKVVATGVHWTEFDKLIGDLVK